MYTMPLLVSIKHIRTKEKATFQELEKMKRPVV